MMKEFIDDIIRNLEIARHLLSENKIVKCWDYLRSIDGLLRALSKRAKRAEDNEKIKKTKNPLGKPGKTKEIIFG